MSYEHSCLPRLFLLGLYKCTDVSEDYRLRNSYPLMTETVASVRFCHNTRRHIQEEESLYVYRHDNLKRDKYFE